MLTAVVTYVAPVGTDNSGRSSYGTNSRTSIRSIAFPIGTTTNTFVVTDAVWTITATCSFDVIIADNEAPVTASISDITQELQIEAYVEM